MDDAVLEGFRAGRPEAVRAVYDEYARLVFSAAQRILNDRSLAEEATQQCFLQAWRACAGFDSARELGPWLATIARRVAIDIHRREARRPTSPFDGVPEDTLTMVSLPPPVEQIFEMWEVRAAIDALPADEREIVRLHHLGQLTHGEIAEKLEIPLGTVKSRSYRAHRNLAARLGHLRDDSIDPQTPQSRANHAGLVDVPRMERFEP